MYGGVLGKMTNPWFVAGLLSTINTTIVSTYSTLEYDYGFQYNNALYNYSYVYEAELTSFTNGMRIANIYQYPQGNNALSLKWGRVVFTTVL